MSAFVLSAKHLNTLITYANVHADHMAWCVQPSGRELCWADCDHLQAAADILRAENERSVNYRYREQMPTSTVTFRFVDTRAMPPAVSIVKACNCYDYQTCETPDYYGTDAARIVDAIRHTAIAQLPGYEKADWAID